MPTGDTDSAEPGHAIHATISEAEIEMSVSSTVDSKPATFVDLLHAVENIRASLDRVHKNVDEGRREQREAERRREEDAKEFRTNLENLRITMMEKDAAFSERLARVEGAVSAGETRRQERVTAAGLLWNAVAALLGGIIAIIGQAMLEIFKKK